MTDAGNIARTARLILEIEGLGALDYCDREIARRAEAGDDEGVETWRKVRTTIEVLLANPPKGSFGPQ